MDSLALKKVCHSEWHKSLFWHFSIGMGWYFCCILMGYYWLGGGATRGRWIVPQTLHNQAQPCHPKSSKNATLFVSPIYRTLVYNVTFISTSIHISIMRHGIWNNQKNTFGGGRSFFKINNFIKISAKIYNFTKLMVKQNKWRLCWGTLVLQGIMWRVMYTKEE
jgi:hypothetical protein